MPCDVWALQLVGISSGYAQSPCLHAATESREWALQLFEGSRAVCRQRLQAYPARSSWQAHRAPSTCGVPIRRCRDMPLSSGLTLHNCTDKVGVWPHHCTPSGFTPECRLLFKTSLSSPVLRVKFCPLAHWVQSHWKKGFAQMQPVAVFYYKFISGAARSTSENVFFRLTCCKQAYMSPLDKHA